MCASTSRLTELPIEILEQVLLELPGQDLLKMVMVWRVVTIPHGSALIFHCMIQISRQFQDLTRDSPILQYKRDLFSAGLIENPRNLCDLVQRRKLCEDHERRWSNAGRVVKTVYEFPEGVDLHRYYITTLGWGIIPYHNTADGSLSFLRPPPVTSQKPTEWWSIPPFPFSLEFFAAYPPDDLLVVAEEKEQ